MVTFPTQLKFPRQTPRISSREPLEARVLLWSKPLGLSAAGNQSCAQREDGHQSRGNAAGRCPRGREQPAAPRPSWGDALPRAFPPGRAPHIPAFFRTLASQSCVPSMPSFGGLWLQEGVTPTPKTCPLRGCPRIPAAPPLARFLGTSPARSHLLLSTSGDTGAAFWCHISIFGTTWARVWSLPTVLTKPDPPER